ncbi:discoidin domain-containing protein [Parapedobacter tibetensis]|uniref:discoidin domain-containing protein n=1 Tax=Parapedobacter tibetensis TaxID=2972951 RepID=UPI00214DA763|nr:discoidin domain-containing protein [Parapedobacter tibetensis]
MKKLINTYGYLLFFGLLLVACAKDGGYYNPVAVEKQFDGDTYAYLKSKPGVYDSLIQVIDRMELAPTLRDSNITLFALTNENFQLAITNLNNIRLLADRSPEYLATINPRHLDTMITQYIIRGKYPTDSMLLQDGVNLVAIRHGYPMHAKLARTTSSGFRDGGPETIDFSDTKKSQFRRNWITTNTGSINIETNNAFVHVINNDHVFGFGDFVSRLTYIPPPPNLFQTIGGIWSTERENSGGPNAIEAAQFAFDGNRETKFLLGGFNGAWLQYKLNTSAVAGAYTLTSANDFPERDPIDWNLQGSHDGENWTTLDSRSGEIFEERFQMKVYRINNEVAYTFYRLNIMRNRSGNTFQMADWSVNAPDEVEE